MKLTLEQKYPIGSTVMHKEYVIPGPPERPLTAVVVGHDTCEDLPDQEVLLQVEWTFEDEGERLFGEDMWSESEIVAANPQLVN